MSQDSGFAISRLFSEFRPVFPTASQSPEIVPLVWQPSVPMATASTRIKAADFILEMYQPPVRVGTRRSTFSRCFHTLFWWRWSFFRTVSLWLTGREDRTKLRANRWSRKMAGWRLSVFGGGGGRIWRAGTERESDAGVGNGGVCGAGTERERGLRGWVPLAGQPATSGG